MSRRAANLILGALLIALLYQLTVGDGGLGDLRRQQALVATRQAENATLALRNAALAAEVEDLRAGGAAIETHARHALGMVRRDETFYLVVNAPGAAGSAEATTR